MVSGMWSLVRVDRSLITRRSLLRTGAAATAAMMLGVRPWAAAPATAASGRHLIRSSYTGLARVSFAVGTGKVRLRSVSDVAGAAVDKSLAGRDDAFVLTFCGALSQPLESGTHTLSHPELGTFELFLSPVARPSTECRYEAVIDRSR
jgi:hypothetical protein